MRHIDKFPLQMGLNTMFFLRNYEKELLEKKLDNLEDLAVLSIESLSVMVGRSLQTTAWKPEQMVSQIHRALKIMQAWDIQHCLFSDNEYPPLLREIFDPPYMLFWRGDIECLHKTCVAMVGTRTASFYGMTTAYDIAKDLSDRGITIVSGLATGIDSGAHKGALSCGQTAAVLACGVDAIYPASNKILGKKILERGGCLLSEYVPGEEPKKWYFPQRNRIISALSSLTLVVEAGPGSGALITADFALEQSRELAFCKNASVQTVKLDFACDQKKRRVEQYIDEGAAVVSSADDIAELLQECHFNAKKESQLVFEL